MKPSAVVPFVEAIREEGRLVRRAKAGDANAFTELYDAYGDNVYRYLYFRVMNDVAAEAMTAHVFRYAWHHLDSFQKGGSTFVQWIYTIARNQVIVYYQLSVKAQALEIGCLPAAADYGLSTDSQDWTNQEAWNAHLRLLAAEKESGLHQTATLLIMQRSLDHLSPGRKPKPSPTFNAYTRQWLTRYLLSHRRQPKRSPMAERLSLIYATLSRSLQFRINLPKLSPMPARMALTSGALMAALLFTGTAEAQAALPGDPLYGWKRTSEQAWLSLSPDPVGTGIVLANRRLNEWIAVEHDPARSSTAFHSYIQALNDLSFISGTAATARVVPVLEVHRRKLQDTGLANAQVDRYINLAENPPLAVAAIHGSGIEGAAIATPAVPSAGVAADVTATAMLMSTQVPPTATVVATEILPLASVTDIPAETVSIATPTDGSAAQGQGKGRGGQGRGKNGHDGNNNGHGNPKPR